MSGGTPCAAKKLEPREGGPQYIAGGSSDTLQLLHLLPLRPENTELLGDTALRSGRREREGIENWGVWRAWGHALEWVGLEQAPKRGQVMALLAPTYWVITGHQAPHPATITGDRSQDHNSTVRHTNYPHFTDKETEMRVMTLPRPLG